MKVLVTGGAGFIGSHVVGRLLQLGHQVVVVDNLSAGKIDNLDSVLDDIDFHNGDIRDSNEMTNLCRGVDIVIHEAAMNRVQRSVDDPIQTNDINVNGTLNVLIAAKCNGVRKVVYASSSSVYGNSMVSPRVETHPTMPLSPYAVSKLAAENYCAAFTNVYGLQTMCLRYFSVYGPRQRADVQYAAVIPKFIDLVRNNRFLPIYGDGLQTRDFTYVDDVVAATMIATVGDASGVYNIGEGSRHSIHELAEYIEEILGQTTGRSYIPLPNGDCRDSTSDISKIVKLGYKPKYDLRSGLEEMLARG